MVNSASSIQNLVPSDVTILLKAHPDTTAVEGWIIFVRNINEEVSDDDLKDKFADFGEITGLQVPINKKTGNFMVLYTLFTYINTQGLCAD